MSSDGTPSGMINLNVNGSVTPVDFWVEPPIPKSVLKIEALTVTINDTGNPSSTGYGNLATLTNGMQLFFEINGFKIPVETPIKRNVDLVGRSQIFEVIQFATVRTVVFRDLLSQYSTSGFQIDARRSEKFGVTVRDDLSTLSNHNFIVKGEYYLSDAS